MRQDNSRTKLSIQAEGLNELNTYCQQLVSILIPQVAKMIGTKIIRANGDFSSKWNELEKVDKPDYHEEKVKHISYQYYITCNGSSLWLTVKICISGGSYDDRTAYTQYFKKEVYLGHVQNQVLISMNTPEEITSGWKLEERFTETQLEGLVVEYQTKKKEADAMFSRIPDSVKEAMHLRS